MGGFECATHRRRDRSRLDLTAATRHDVCAAEDYRLLAQAGIRTVRDGLRWHLIEATRGVYDWASLRPLIEAANQTGTQVIWDLCHWGLPDWLDPFAEEFAERFTALAVAAVRFLLEQRTASAFPDLFCAINEISFWAWVGGDEEHFHPYASGRGGELKQQLALASIMAIKAVRAEHPGVRFVQPEPIIQVSPNDEEPDDPEGSAEHTAGQFEAWDMIAGTRDPELGGSAQLLDLIGVNYYWNNQWINGSDRTPPGHHLHRPLHAMLAGLWERYGRPILITETGAESDAALGWLGYICAEVRQAQRLGVPVVGVCLYPVMDYPGWDDGRHCECGVIGASEDWETRTLRSDLAEELQVQSQLLRGDSQAGA